jgi:hypothetical protein
MKKQLVMFICSFTLAASAALGFRSAEFDVYVAAKFSTLPTSPIECINTFARCNDSGYQVCSVLVPLHGGGYAVATTIGPYHTYSSSGCVYLLKNTTSTTIDATITLPPHQLPVSLAHW